MLTAEDFSQSSSTRTVNPWPGSSLVHQVFSTNVPFVVKGREEVCCCRACLDEDFKNCSFKDHVNPPVEITFTESINHLPVTRSSEDVEITHDQNNSIDLLGPIAILIKPGINLAIFSYSDNEDESNDFFIVQAITDLTFDDVSGHYYLKGILLESAEKDIAPAGCSVYVLTNKTVLVEFKSIIKAVSTLKLISKKQRKKLARYSLDNIEKEALCLSI